MREILRIGYGDWHTIKLFHKEAFMGKVAILEKNKEKKMWNKLLRNQGYSKEGAKSATEKIVLMDNSLKQEFIRWTETGVLPNIEIEGFDFSGLRNSLGLSETATFLMMDWLLRDPEQAKLSMAESLDRVIILDETLEDIDRAEEEDNDDE